MPDSEEARKATIADLLAEQERTGTATRIPLPWRGSRESFVVIRLPLDCAVLNHRSHRIRAQLESHPRLCTVESNPAEDEAQNLIADLLREQDGFDTLKSNIAEAGQTDPGIVTHRGLLVNANRRAVALRDLHIGYVDVAVLPETASDEEIDRLELALQMRRDFKEEYTYTNDLLFVDELLSEHGDTTKAVALQLGWAASQESREMNKGVKKVEQATRILALIRNIQHESNNRIPITFFDEKISHLEEADEIFEKGRMTDPAEANSILSGRLLGTITGAHYRDLRLFGPGFFDEYIRPQMEESAVLQAIVDLALVKAAGDGSVNKTPPGVDILEEDESDLDTVRALYLLAATGWSTSESDQVQLPIGDKSVSMSIPLVFDTITDAIDQAATAASTDRKIDKTVGAPIKHINLASRSISRAEESLARVKANSEFDGKKFNFTLRKLRRQVEAIWKDRE